MRSSSEVLGLLIHATTLDEPFHMGDYMWPPHIMNKSLEYFTNAQVGCKVIAMKLNKQQLLQPACLGYDQIVTVSTRVAVW